MAKLLFTLRTLVCAAFAASVILVGLFLAVDIIRGDVVYILVGSGVMIFGLWLLIYPLRCFADLVTPLKKMNGTVVGKRYRRLSSDPLADTPGAYFVRVGSRELEVSSGDYDKLAVGQEVAVTFRLGTGKVEAASVVVPGWASPTVLALLQAIIAEDAYDRLPILADAMEEAGCTNAELVRACREVQDAEDAALLVEGIARDIGI